MFRNNINKSQEVNILKKIPQRTCIGCNEKKDKKEFIRIVKDNQNNISIDKTGKANGRGAYICDNIECLEKAIKTKRLEKCFDMKIDEHIYNELRGVIIDKSNQKKIWTKNKKWG